MTTAAKNRLAQTRSRDRLFDILVNECETLGFDYDTSRSMTKNASRARERMMWGVAEIINYADKLESSL